MSKTTKTSGKISLVFFGSGPVAARSLALLSQNFDIEAVITKPTTVNEISSSMKEVCIYSVKNRVELDELISSRPFVGKIGVLIDFGIIVSQNIIDYFPMGIVNSHFSLLPHLRGADPITFSILQGDTKTGVSLMLIDSGIDTGKLLAQRTYQLTDGIDTPKLTDELILLSNSLLVEYLPRYVAGEVRPHAQPHPDRATYSRKLTKEDGILDFNKPAVQLEREIRAFAGWPKSRTIIAGKDVIITKAHAVPSNFSDKPGEIGVVKDVGTLMISCADGYLCIDKLKPAGKREMTATAFIAGYGQNLTSNL